jgi:hypothetical protein
MSNSELIKREDAARFVEMVINGLPKPGRFDSPFDMEIWRQERELLRLVADGLRRFKPSDLRSGSGGRR